MATRRNAAPALVSKIDPTLPFALITVAGMAYKMCFDYAALALAEDALNAKGLDVNILIPMIKRTFSSVRVLFAVSLFAYQPELFPDAAAFAAVQNWVTHKNLLEVMTAVNDAWNKSVPEPTKVDPPKPGE